MSWLSRAGARLMPAGRREWAEAVWAEAQEVPPGWPPGRGGAGQDELPGRYGDGEGEGEGDQGPPGLVGAGLGRLP